MKSMWDAAHPPAHPPAGFDAAAGYIGGDTPHVWTLQEWKRLGALPKLPIWVQDAPDPDRGDAEAWAALNRLYRIGCPPGHAVALDLETSATTATGEYVHAFGKVLQFYGYYVWVYGSRSTVTRNPALNGYWIADYTHQPHMLPGPVRAVQWTDGQVFDQSVIKWWSWRRRLWR